MLKLEQNKKEIKERTYARNRRTNKIRKMIDDYNKDKAKPKSKPESNKGNRQEEGAIKKVKDLMNEVIEKGSTKYMYNLIKNEKDPNKADTLIKNNQKTLSKLEEDAIDILSKLYNIGKKKAIEQIGASLIYNFSQTRKLNKARVKATTKKYYKNR